MLQQLPCNVYPLLGENLLGFITMFQQHNPPTTQHSNIALHFRTPIQQAKALHTATSAGQLIHSEHQQRKHFFCRWLSVLHQGLLWLCTVSSWHYGATSTSDCVQTASLLVKFHAEIKQVFFWNLQNMNKLKLLLSRQLDDSTQWVNRPAAGGGDGGLVWCIIAAVCYGTLWAFIRPSCLCSFSQLLLTFQRRNWFS